MGRSNRADQRAFMQFVNPYKLMELGLYDEAIESWSRSYHKNPNDLAVISNLGVALTYVLRLDEAIAIYRDALQRFPDHPLEAMIRWNLAIPLLTQGNLKEGFALYESRTLVKQLVSRYKALPTPRWQGEKIDGKTVLIRCTEGLGDAIQFLRYLPELSQYRCKSILAVQTELHGLFGHLGFPLASLEREVPYHDVNIDVMSFPYLFHADLENIPPPVSLAIARSPGKRRIAIAWRGNPNTARDRHRSVPLSYLVPLFDLRDVYYISLQKDLTPEEEMLLISYGVACPKLASLSETVELLKTCELVISVDTMLAHLAGSIGIPTWILISYVPEWRWLLDRTNSPWYPSVTLFRQKALDDWNELIQRVRANLFSFSSKAP